MSQNVGVDANINWPVVAGLAITGGVLWYAMSAINKQLSAGDALIGGAANDVQSILSPFTTFSNWVSSWFGSLSGGGSSGAAGGGADDGGSSDN